jgi:hypothetical protein
MMDTMFKTIDYDSASKQFHIMVYQAIGSMGAAARHAKNEELRNLLHYTAQNGVLLKKPKAMNISPSMFNTLKM